MQQYRPRSLFLSFHFHFLVHLTYIHLTHIYTYFIFHLNILTVHRTDKVLLVSMLFFKFLHTSWTSAGLKIETARIKHYDLCMDMPYHLTGYWYSVFDSKSVGQCFR